ncbi:hypothetical protein VTN77DRAFT_4055 [Rasamsonia byssochlamydoides]|uniref:uncharacterized protein n=1 Tax=Rasamsonia byssochlamydoides TaxID=89139 RepID=UPI0037425D71
MKTCWLWWTRFAFRARRIKVALQRLASPTAAPLSGSGEGDSQRNHGVDDTLERARYRSDHSIPSTMA